MDLFFLKGVQYGRTLTRKCDVEKKNADIKDTVLLFKRGSMFKTS